MAFPQRPDRPAVPPRPTLSDGAGDAALSHHQPRNGQGGEEREDSEPKSLPENYVMRRRMSVWSANESEAFGSFSPGGRKSVHMPFSHDLVLSPQDSVNMDSSQATDQNSAQSDVISPALVHAFGNLGSGSAASRASRRISILASSAVLDLSSFSDFDDEATGALDSSRPVDDQNELTNHAKVSKSSSFLIGVEDDKLDEDLLACLYSETSTTFTNTASTGTAAAISATSDEVVNQASPDVAEVSQESSLFEASDSSSVLEGPSANSSSTTAAWLHARASSLDTNASDDGRERRSAVSKPRLQSSLPVEKNSFQVHRAVSPPPRPPRQKSTDENNRPASNELSVFRAPTDDSELLDTPRSSKTRTRLRTIRNVLGGGASKKRQEKHDVKARMASEYERLQTFRDASKPYLLSSPSAEELAGAGLFFAPTEAKPDRCVCYSCGVALNGWRTGDNPKSVHKIYAKSCPLALTDAVDHSRTHSSLAGHASVPRRGSFGPGSKVASVLGLTAESEFEKTNRPASFRPMDVSLDDLTRPELLAALGTILRERQRDSKHTAVAKPNMLGLEPEALALIFARLDAASRVRCMMVCRAWKFVCLMFPLWGADDLGYLGFDLTKLSEATGAVRLATYSGRGGGTVHEDPRQQLLAARRSTVDTATSAGSATTMPLQAFLLQQYRTLLAQLALIPASAAYETERTTLLVRMMALLRGAGDQGMYVTKINMLVSAHLQLGNFVEAGLCLLLQADSTTWEELEKRDAARTAALSLKGGSFFRSVASRAQPIEDVAEFESVAWKKRLFLKAVDYFSDGKYWELGVSLLQELRKHNISSSELLMMERDLYLAIKSQDRFFESYYLVEFFGLGFADEFYRNRKYVYRGKEAEPLPKFLERVIKPRFPQACIVQGEPSDDLQSSPDQHIRVRSCKVSSQEELDGQERVFPETMPKMIRRFHAQHDVCIFKMSKAFKRLNPKMPQIEGNDIDGMWTSDTFVITRDAFPTLRRVVAVEEMIVQERSPVETSVGAVEEKTTDIALRAEQATVSREYKSPFTMTLNGVLDAAVSGGISKYKEAFFSDRFLSCASDEDRYFAVKLQLALETQVETVRDALVIHRRVAPEKLGALLDRMDMLVEKLAATVSQLAIKESWAASIREIVTEQREAAVAQQTARVAAVLS